MQSYKKNPKVVLFFYKKIRNNTCIWRRLSAFRNSPLVIFLIALGRRVHRTDAAATLYDIFPAPKKYLLCVYNSTKLVSLWYGCEEESFVGNEWRYGQLRGGAIAARCGIRGGRRDLPFLREGRLYRVSRRCS